MNKNLLNLLLMLLLALLIAGCGNQGDPVGGSGMIVAPDALPEGPGRGFPTVLIEGRQSGTPPQAGSPSPNFRLVLEDGRSLTLESLRGRPVLINHWATWCPPCRREMPDIARAAEEHKDLVVIAANFMETRAQVVPFAAEFGMEFPVALDHEGLLSDLYATNGLPASIFIDREGVVRAIWPGLITPEKLEELLAMIL